MSGITITILHRYKFIIFYPSPKIPIYTVYSTTFENHIWDVFELANL